MVTHLIDELPRVFRGRDAVAHGALTPRQLRGPAVQRIVQGVYTRAGTPLTHRLEAEGVGLLLPRGAVITGRSAATIRGVELARGEDDVEVLLHVHVTADVLRRPDEVVAAVQRAVRRQRSRVR